ncbi:MAG: hypothetical protein KUG82_19140 [Pseudomonadales bacterium]|nr:hypothetical protein [Pseudomonadales bacterium]
MNHLSPIGGELPLADFFPVVYTDSGRSSLRLLLNNTRMKRVLLPDFLCGTIVSVFSEYKVQIEYYSVPPDLSFPDEIVLQIIERARAEKEEIDALYLIAYFGVCPQVSEEIISQFSDIWIDNVFSINSVCLPLRDKVISQGKRVSVWNSFRKFGAMVEGSELICSQPLSLESGLISGEAPYVEAKYQATRNKQHVIDGKSGVNAEYLALFEEGERLIDKQADCYRLSDRGLFCYLRWMENIEDEKGARLKNWAELDAVLGGCSVHKSLEYAGLATHYPILTDDAISIRLALRQEGVFLPGFWPNEYHLSNRLYSTLLCIPVDSLYEPNELMGLARWIVNYVDQH